MCPCRSTTRPHKQNPLTCQNEVIKELVDALQRYIVHDNDGCICDHHWVCRQCKAQAAIDRYTSYLRAKASTKF